MANLERDRMEFPAEEIYEDEILTDLEKREDYDATHQTDMELFDEERSIDQADHEEEEYKKIKVARRWGKILNPRNK